MKTIYESSELLPTQPARKDEIRGITIAVLAHLCWGVFPIYWKLIQYLPTYEILVHRILWCFIFTIILIIITRQWSGLKEDIAILNDDRRKLLAIMCAALFINANWFIYIWAVNHDHIIDASLGFYISPLVSVLLGTMVLKERLNFWQYLAFFFALAGVMNMILRLGYIPWVSLYLAISFAIYGLIKKTVPLRALSSLTLETSVVSFFAIGFIIYFQVQGMGHFSINDSYTMFLLMGGGVATAIPLLLFAHSARFLPLTLIGFIQYLSPTISLIIGVRLYNEAFTSIHLVSFLFIWAGLLLFSWTQTKRLISINNAVKAINMKNDGNR